jgi:hypothetical protein
MAATASPAPHHAGVHRTTSVDVSVSLTSNACRTAPRGYQIVMQASGHSRLCLSQSNPDILMMQTAQCPSSTYRVTDAGVSRRSTLRQLRPFKIFHQGATRARRLQAHSLTSKDRSHRRLRSLALRSLPLTGRPGNRNAAGPKGLGFALFSIVGRRTVIFDHGLNASSVTRPVRRDSDFDGARCPGHRIDLKPTPNLF